MKPFDTGRIRTLLIRGTNWVGDSILSLPAVKLARLAFPQAQITLLVHPWVSGVYDECQAVDEVLIYDRKGVHRGLSGKLRLAGRLRERRFDAALLFQNAFEAAALAYLAGIPVRAGYDRDGRGWLLSHKVAMDPRVSRLHQTYYYLDLVEQLLGRPRSALGVEPKPASQFGAETMPDITLAVSAQRKQLARTLLQAQGVDFSQTVIGVNPGAFYGSAKRWLSERYAAVLDRLIDERNSSVVIFGSPNEVAIAEAIQAGTRGRPVLLSGRTQLNELIAMLACCDLLITNDSGPMHLAAALRIPTLAIFGATDEIATGPMSPSAVVLNKRVECSPCLLRECPIDHRCMTRITVEEVAQQAFRMIDAGQRLRQASETNQRN
ncbi:MAG: lipopolysaccharide heptosyltransferase II [Acidobacteria bacterium]|nr:lipopolysaccharide heptosyltransferase II [Acidobacteriota bacterium]MCI0718471.1 lipopolysaccharide heptosyltransferase II [Acidobacteriota bacterium]